MVLPLLITMFMIIDSTFSVKLQVNALATMAQSLIIHQKKIDL